MNEREILAEVHRLRYEAHWGKSSPPPPFPADDKEMRAAAHGSALDSAVEMARFHLKLAQRIKDEGLLK